MGRPPRCDKLGMKKGSWTPEEDIVLVSYIQKNGPGNWRAVATNTGLMRCDKSCRLRWTNCLRPNIKRGNFTKEEEKMIIRLHALFGNKWAVIASYLRERTNNDIKNYWNIHLKKKLRKLQGDGGEGQFGYFQEDDLSPASSSQSHHNKGQWERRLQTDVHTAKQALCEALSLDKPISSAAVQFPPQPYNQTSPYALSADNIARLLNNWNTQKPKLAQPNPDYGLDSSIPTPPGTGSESGSSSSEALSLDKPISATVQFPPKPYNQTSPYAVNADNIARLLENWNTQKPKYARPKPATGSGSCSSEVEGDYYSRPFGSFSSSAATSDEQSDDTGKERDPLLIMMEKWLLDDLS